MSINVCCCFSFVVFSVKTNGAQKALGILLEMLDFACWRSNLDVWKLLQVVIHDLQLQYVYVYRKFELVYFQ